VKIKLDPEIEAAIQRIVDDLYDMPNPDLPPLGKRKAIPLSQLIRRELKLAFERIRENERE